MEDSPMGLTSIEDICANDIPQVFYDSQCMILALNAEQEKETDLRSQYIAIPWTEGPNEQTVLVVDLHQRSTYLIPVLRFIQEEFDIVAWVCFENSWKQLEQFEWRDTLNWIDTAHLRCCKAQEHQPRLCFGCPEDVVIDPSNAHDIMRLIHQRLNEINTLTSNVMNLTCDVSQPARKTTQRVEGAYPDYMSGLERNALWPKDF
jgi:hypothetical protein